MTTCHCKVKIQSTLSIWLFILFFNIVLATDGLNFDYSSDIGQKLEVKKQEIPVSTNLNENLKEVLLALAGQKNSDKVVSEDGSNSKRYVEYNDGDTVENDDDNYQGIVPVPTGNGNKKRHESPRPGEKVWDRWGKWGICSVSCGIGKMTRWRHCVSGSCASGEKEAQIKTCSLPSC